MNINGVHQDVFIHSSAYVDEGCNIGEGTKIWHFSHVMAGAIIGKQCILGQNVFIGKGVIIGDNVKIQNNVSVFEGVVLDDDVFLGPGCTFTNVINPRSFVDRKNEYRETRVLRGASIGANATIICGHVIGMYALVGAGSVVTKDVPDYALVTGNPAKPNGWVSKNGLKLNFDENGQAICTSTGEKYSLIGKVVASSGMEG